MFKKINFFEGSFFLRFSTMKEKKEPGSDLLSHARADAVPSALGGSLVLFGMGRQVSPPVWPPSSKKKIRHRKIKRKDFQKNL
jgi:hypothetical protein